MPHLRFDLSVPVADDERAAFAERVAETYARVMDTGTDHVGVLVREGDPRLGRAAPDEPVALVNADVRVGRTVEQRHELARLLTGALGDRFGIPERTVYVVFTEHEGADFVLGGEPLDSWDEGEATGESNEEPGPLGEGGGSTADGTDAAGDSDAAVVPDEPDESDHAGG